MNNIQIIGLGGIGSILCDSLCRFMNYDQNNKYHVILMDGDAYESKNSSRQSFNTFGNKAIVKESEIRLQYEKITTENIPKYISESNIHTHIKSNSVVFLCVDNHATRKLVSDYCKSLDDIILISGGNEFTDGNVQIYIRKNGVDITSNLTDYHPEIQNPADKNPDDMSCQELAFSSPQLLFTNLTVATIMLWVFYSIVNTHTCKFGEIYFDIESMSVLPKERKPINN